VAVRNEEVAAVFDEIADLLEIRGENPFRVRAYRNAARTVRSLGRDVAGLVAAGEDLTRLPGIGRDLAGKIREIVGTGTSATLEALRRELPPGLGALLRLPGLGPRRVAALHRELGITSLEALRRAAETGRLRSLPGFGPKTEARVLEAIRAHLDTGRRFLLAEVEGWAEALAGHLRAGPGVDEVVVAGSFRRRRETVGDLDILCTARDGAAVAAHFTAHERVAEVLSRGPTRTTVVLQNGLQVDLRVVPEAGFGAALHYFTGSKAHNIAVRRMGQRRGLKINEYGVFRGARRVAGATEESVFRSVGLPWIPPELREDRGEIEAALAGKLPRLVELRDLRGDLHCHTRASDGRSGLEEMARAAREAGLEYLAVTEHSRSLRVARGLDARRLRAHVEAIRRLDERLEGITLLTGIEVEILEDGRLDLPDSVLAELDIVVGAVHTRFDLPRARQTRRILRAMDHPHFHLLAHPSGRLLLQREPYDVDMARIIRHARERGCFLELNANPDRLDLDDVHCRMARDEGVLVAICSDAHSSLGFANLRFGVGQARRGWLGPEHVLNTRPLGELRRLLAAARAGPA